MVKILIKYRYVYSIDTNKDLDIDEDINIYINIDKLMQTNICPQINIYIDRRIV